MRLASEIQAAVPQQNHYRTSQENVHQSHETLTNLSSSPDEIAQHLARAAEATNDAVRVWTLANGALSWPQGLESLLGYTSSSATDEIGFWQKQLHPQDRARAAASIRDALASDGDHWTGEYRFRHLDGSYLDLLERAYIVRDRLGRAVEWIGSVMNITARKQLQDQLVRSQKMEAFGQLAGGVAHDFNNFLTTILGYSDLLLDELGMKGEIANHIREIRGAAGRASALTSQLLAFSRKHPLAPCVVDVNSLLTNLERSLLRLLGENISVQCDFERGKDGMHTKVDPGQLTQIILNLVVNAPDAMPGSGTTSSRRVRSDQRNRQRQWHDRRSETAFVRAVFHDEGRRRKRPGPRDQLRNCAAKRRPHLRRERTGPGHDRENFSAQSARPRPSLLPETGRE
jgi:PAS domain S-box-containing protein